MIETIGVAALAACLTAALLAFLARRLPAGFLSATTTARSNHFRPARQIGGFGLASGWSVAVVAAAMFSGLSGVAALALALAFALLVLIGFLDDLRHLPVQVRLAAQIVAALLALYALPELGWPAEGSLSGYVGLALAVLVLIASVNIVNFMDGLDLMSVAGAGLPLGFAAIALALGAGPTPVGLVAASGAGGMAAFAVFNRPPAQIFLGDSGSQPLGLAVGLAILALWGQAGLLAGLLPFSYYIADGLSTIALRAVELEPVWRAHSRHAYQVAYRAGRSALHVSAAVAAWSVASGLLLLLPGLVHPLAVPVAQAIGLAGAIAVALWLRLVLPGPAIP